MLNTKVFAITFLISETIMWLLFSFIENRIINPLSILGSSETKGSAGQAIINGAGEYIGMSSNTIYHSVNIDGRFFLLLVIAFIVVVINNIKNSVYEISW